MNGINKKAQTIENAVVLHSKGPVAPEHILKLYTALSCEAHVWNFMKQVSYPSCRTLTCCTSGE